MIRWALHQEPHRHYKHLGDNGKWSWNGYDKRRIASVTQVLDGEQDRLTQWATGQALVAGERVATTWLGAAPCLSASVLSFSQLAALTGVMPNDVRDAKARSGTLMHTYAAARLSGSDTAVEHLPYGLKTAIDAFMRDSGACAVIDSHGPRVERAVGDSSLAVAGTYDAQISVLAPSSHAEPRLQPGRHRLDFKQSRTLQPKMLAQVAGYEALARVCGEEPSDYLTLVHLDPTGDYRTYSIRCGDQDHACALHAFHAAVDMYRYLPRLAKLLTPSD